MSDLGMNNIYTYTYKGNKNRNVVICSYQYGKVSGNTRVRCHDNNVSLIPENIVLLKYMKEEAEGATETVDRMAKLSLTFCMTLLSRILEGFFFTAGGRCGSIELCFWPVVCLTKA